MDVYNKNKYVDPAPADSALQVTSRLLGARPGAGAARSDRRVPRGETVSQGNFWSGGGSTRGVRNGDRPSRGYAHDARDACNNRKKTRLWDL